MLDFTSALYLGLGHPSRELRSWAQLTTGRPAALEPHGRSNAVEAMLAELVGCDDATLAPSTLHLFWDVFLAVGPARPALYLDAGAYPVARWGAERAASRGLPLRVFPHHDAGALERLLQRRRRRRERPIVAADGFCPACRAFAPIAAYAELTERYGGLLVLDDTQALGIFGGAADGARPYGRGGGGTLRWTSVRAPHVLLVSSLAKALGVPVAVLAGTRQYLAQYKARSDTRMHCSPPSAAAIRAAESAVDVNAHCGDAIRARLAARVTRFRRAVDNEGLCLLPGMFPAQTLAASDREMTGLHRDLEASGVRTVLHADRGAPFGRLSFLITAAHRDVDLEMAAARLGELA